MITISRKALSILLLSYAAVNLIAIWPLKYCMSEKRRENAERDRQIEEEAREDIKGLMEARLSTPGDSPSQPPSRSNEERNQRGGGEQQDAREGYEQQKR